MGHLLPKTGQQLLGFLLLCTIPQWGHADILLPIEVIGPDGYVAAVRFELEDAQEANYLYLTVHRPAYEDALTNPGRGAKASIQLNEEAWIDLTNQTVEVDQPAASYGGLGGGFHTLRFRVPIQGALTGVNTLRFRFNGTDGLTSGYRVIALNLLRDTTPLLAEDQFVQDDPSTWQPPLKGAEDIAQGQALWNGKELRESPLADNLLRASCGDCHAHNGRDLKYFNYSNWSIEERSKFHGLNDTEARQIASYIRSLEGPAPAQARPWNPPYQPGPGLDSKPVEEWAAGAGLGAVLDRDADMFAYLLPQGSSPEQIAKVVDVEGTLNLRELPVAVQFPDWNEWLPRSHPKDVFPTTFEQGEAQQSYQALRDQLTTERETLITQQYLPGALSTLMNGTIAYFTEGQTDDNWQWRARNSPVLDGRDAAFSLEVAKEQLAKWVATKSWEVMHEFELEDVAPQVFERGEAHAWPLNTRSTFNVAPHIVASNKNHFVDQDPLLGEYRSSVWYQLQMTLNAGQRRPRAEHPVDWPYQQKHVRELAERSKVWDGLRHITTQIKVYQESDNGLGPQRTGWELRRTHPHWLYSNPNGDTRLMESLDAIEGGLKNRLVNGMLREFLDQVTSFEESEWTRCEQSEPSTKRWFCVEPKDHVPLGYTGRGFTGQTYHFEADNWYGPDKIFFFPQNYHADNFYRLLPLLEQSGVDTQLLDELTAWCQRMWPEGDWNAQRRRAVAEWYVVRNRLTGEYLTEQDSLASYGPLATTDAKQQWQLVPVEGGGAYHLKNRASQSYLYIENLLDYAEFTTDTGFYSAHWRIIPEEGPYVRLQNRWDKNPNLLHTQDERGYVQQGPIQEGAYSAQWEFIATDTDVSEETPSEPKDISLQAEEYVNQEGRRDKQGTPWQQKDALAGYTGQGYVTTEDLGQCVTERSGGGLAGARLNYSFSVPQADIYHLWVRRYASHGGDNSAYFALDNKVIEQQDNRGYFRRWYWIKLGSYSLDAGDHSLALVRREDGYAADAFLFTPEDIDPNQRTNPSQANQETVATTSPTSSTIRAYPNPVSDGLLHVSTAEVAGRVERVELLGVQGQALRSLFPDGPATWLLDVSDLPPGLYVVKAYGPQRTWEEKILIE